MKIDWKGWLGWVAVTMVGAELVMLIIFWELVSPPSSLRAWLQSLGIIGLVGTVFGTLQWIWLSHRMSKAGWWIPATVVGWYLAVGFNILGEWHAVSGIALLEIKGYEVFRVDTGHLLPNVQLSPELEP